MAKNNDPKAPPPAETCSKCEGSRFVDNVEGKPWSRFNRIRSPHVASGRVQPVQCDKCKGKGFVDGTEGGTKEEKELAEHLAAVEKEAPRDRTQQTDSQPAS